MKSISQFITEAYDDKTIKDLVVEYKFPKFKFTLNAPETYEESDIQQYLDDYVLSKLPNDASIGKKAFGINYSFISDAYFEYDKYEKLGNKQDKIDLEWNDEYANDNVDQDEKNVTFILYNFKYILKFDKFNIKYDKNVKKTLKELFKTYESNDNNKYPIELKFDSKALIYTE